MTARPTLAPQPSSKPVFIAHAFLGRMTPQDQAYMARALLALSDENAEIKQRIAALELVMRGLVIEARETALKPNPPSSRVGRRGA